MPEVLAFILFWCLIWLSVSLSLSLSLSLSVYIDYREAPRQVDVREIAGADIPLRFPRPSFGSGSNEDRCFCYSFLAVEADL